MDANPDVQAAREKLKQKFEGVRTGGKGSTRRKKRTTHHMNGADDKQLQSQLKKLQVNSIPGIEEVNMFKDDGMVLHFASPKVQASVAANTYVISGVGENKSLQDLLPNIINQLGPDNLMNLKRIAESFSAGKSEEASDANVDVDIPDLGNDNFEDVSASGLSSGRRVGHLGLLRKVHPRQLDGESYDPVLRWLRLFDSCQECSCIDTAKGLNC